MSILVLDAGNNIIKTKIIQQEGVVGIPNDILKDIIRMGKFNELKVKTRPLK